MIRKKTYIPSKPRNKNLSTGATTVAGVGKTEFNQVEGSSHEHSNKGVLDLISQSDIDVLNLLSVVDGNIKVDTPLWTTGELSAYGIGAAGGGGGSDYERLDTWASYDSSKAGWVLSAFLGNDLNTRVTAIDDRLTDLENTAGSGSVTSVGISVPTGLSVSNSPITSSGVIAIGLQAGYSIPTTTKQGQWDTAYSNTHTHSNKTVLDGITSTLISHWNTAYTNNHTHSNKTQLDLITQSNIDVLAKLSIVNGNLQIDGNAYATGELSAYGAGDGGGGGGIIETVYGYDNLGQTFNNSILTDTFNAYTINQINTRLIAVESGSALTVNTTGTGNAITSISKSGTVITANKGLTFALSSHTHTIAQITGLQTALGGKEPSFTKNTAFNKNFGTVAGTVAQGNDSRIINGQTAFSWGNHATAGYALNSAFNTHNTDNVRHITGAERTKWDKVVTDFEELEIGGRNLVRNSESDWVEVTNQTIWHMWITDRINVEPEETYTYSVDWKKGEYNQRLQVRLYDEYGAYMYDLFNSPLLSDENQSGRNSYTFTVPSDSHQIQLGFRIQDAGVPNSYSYRLPKLERGNKATDWTPAPEDQVSDWNTTDVNSFSFIKNKPTLLSQFTDNIGVAAHIANTSNPHSVTKAQVGLGNVDNTADSAKNVLSATKLTTARTIAGVSFDGTANIAIPFANLSSKPTTLGGYGITDAVTLNTAQTITGAKTFTGNITLGINKYIKGTDNYAGVWNVDNLLWRFGSKKAGSVANIRSEKVGIGTDTPSQKLHVIGNILATGTTTTTKVIFSAAGWSMEQVGSELQMKHNNVLKMRFTSTGAIVATNEITAFG